MQKPMHLSDRIVLIASALGAVFLIPILALTA